ncbi:ATP-binding protein [Chlorogloea sp. CCALA 695]|uniref:ATP-binding protein n=1 Tax=Chlorogloea sp. CCALA 695 TaxID=2107693 RepID=UPI000D07CE9A|nr:ATP-binding protein [Chlorogloea sp. CCALA 695]PSB29996.1 ATPase [Chlorogloea sp. CCALA 695]
MTIANTFENWQQANKDFLLVALEQVSSIMKSYIDRGEKDSSRDLPNRSEARFSPKDILPETSTPPALETLCKRFNLSDFEKNLLLLCVGVELDLNFPELCAEAHGVNHQHFPTFGLALRAFPNSHWSALAPSGPLRRWKLIDLGPGKTLTNTALYIDERILHYLVGVEMTDTLLIGMTELSQKVQQLIPSHQSVADKIEALWKLSPARNLLPIIQLCGSEIEDKTDIAQAVCDRFERRVSLLYCHCIPLNPEDLGFFIRRLKRECILNCKALVLNCDDIDPADQQQRVAINQLLDQLEGFVIVTTLFPLQGIKRQMIRFDVPKPLPQEQLSTWKTSMTEFKTQLNGQGECIPDSDKLLQDLQVLTSQFQLSTSMIRRACTAAVAQLTMPSAPSLQQALWQSCRIQARPGLDELAERIESKLSWDDLVLPPLQKETLKEISAHVRQKAKVYEKWGFASKSRRGLGITALFSGPSGTGKTLAAGVLANELNLDLYRIELSAVVSKYIGETEKNLQQIFNAAESGGVILLFDEADSIFGKRSEVKDSKDRNANLEVSYLLQRMESYPGMAILTTNLQSNLDPAFMRRLRFVTQFSLPDAAHRAEIWRRIFPPDTPTEGLSVERLAQLNAPGGNIRIIALNAAFIAADAEEPVQMKHILRATQTEYEKLGKSLTSVEISGWI